MGWEPLTHILTSYESVCAPSVKPQKEDDPHLIAQEPSTPTPPFFLSVPKLHFATANRVRSFYPISNASVIFLLEH